MTMPVGKICEFDLSSGNWTLYCERLEMYFKANKIEDGLKLPTLISLVGERTYELMVNLVSPRKPAELSYEALTTIIREHVQPRPSVMAERYRFRQRRQGVGESITQYIAELRKMSKDCEFGTVLNDNLRDQFVCGVNSDLIRQRLFSESDLSFARAVTLATALEAAERDSAAVDRGTGAGVRGLTDAMHAMNVASGGGSGRGCYGDDGGGAGRRERAGPHQRNSVPCEACAAPGHSANKCRFKSYVCSNCKTVGHLRRACRNRKYDGGGRFQQRPQRAGRNQGTFYVEEEEAGRSSSGSDEEEEAIFQMSLRDYKPVSVTVSVNGHNIQMEIDTGTACSCVNKQTYQALFGEIELSNSNVCFKFYDGSTVKPLGLIKVQADYESRSKCLDLYVVEKGVTSLIGRQWLAELGIQVPKFDCNNHFNVNLVPKQLSDILDRHKSVLSSELGCYTGGTAVLRVREGATPVFRRARPLPYALRERVDAELDAMLASGVIEPVDCSDWATPLVIVNKKDGAIRVCADFKVTLNPVLLVDRYPLPRVEDVFANLAGGQDYSKIDLSQAYAQICLSEDSKKYTIVNTHRGLFRYNRLVYGLSSSSGIFQRIMSELVKNIPGVQTFLDDIICTGVDRQSHLNSLAEIFSRLETAGLKVKKAKCQFLKKEIKFLGFIVDKNGIRPDPEKIKAMEAMPPPRNISELKSFLGMVNFYGKFIPKLSEILEPLHSLLCKHTRWCWTQACDVAFTSVKRKLLNSNILAHYDPRKQLVLTCDASSVGVGGVLSQRDAGGSERAVSYVSRKLTSAERAYSQIHKEALAIVYCVKKFHQYLYGRRFTLKTDHKPLVSIFGPGKGIPTMAASRMQRWALILSGYDFEIEYVRTDKNGADILSRLPIDGDVSYEPPEQTYLHFATNSMLLDYNTIKKETAKDQILSRVYGYIENGWPREVSVRQMSPLFNRKDELYTELGCVMWGHRLVVPEGCRQEVLRELHEPHMGVVKTKAHARSYVWWPGLDEAIEETCRQCTTCAAVAPNPPAAAPVPWRWPQRPYERVHLDFLGPIEGQTYLITIDARSKWVEAFRMSKTTATATINKLRESWARWGLPKQVVSDNGPPFSSNEFSAFLSKNGITQTFSAPYHPASNGAAENAVKMIKRVIKKAYIDKVDPEIAICRYLLVYHNTPHCTTGETPANLLQGRRLRTRLDALRPTHGIDKKKHKHLSGNYQHTNHTTERVLAPGDTVWSRNFTKGHKWVSGQVAKRQGKNDYTVITSDGLSKHRHIDQLKRRSRCSSVFPDNYKQSSDDDGVVESGETAQAQRSESERDATDPGASPPPPATPAVDKIVTSSVGDGAVVSNANGGVPKPDSCRIPLPPPTDDNVLSATTNEAKRPRKPVAKYGFDFEID